MKILHTADWHIGQFKGPVVDGVNLRSQDTVNCLNYMIKVAEEEKPDIVCVSGDVFHQEQIGPVRYSDEMIVATDTITKLAGVAKAVIVMRGTPNHDGGGQFRVLSKMFANTGNVHIVTSPTVLRTPYADIACIPGFDKQEFRSRFPGLSADEENEALFPLVEIGMPYILPEEFSLPLVEVKCGISENLSANMEGNIMVYKNLHQWNGEYDFDGEIQFDTEISKEEL